MGGSRGGDGAQRQVMEPDRSSRTRPPAAPSLPSVSSAQLAARTHLVNRPPADEQIQNSDPSSRKHNLPH